jgi:Mg-chelatase subunit ChlI
MQWKHKTVFPFSAIVGQEKMKQALILNVINPKIGGVLLRGEKGTGKSIAVRALANLLPEVNVVTDCPFHCDPQRPKTYAAYAAPK